MPLLLRDNTAISGKVGANEMILYRIPVRYSQDKIYGIDGRELAMSNELRTCYEGTRFYDERGYALLYEDRLVAAWDNDQNLLLSSKEPLIYLNKFTNPELRLIGSKQLVNFAHDTLVYHFGIPVFSSGYQYISLYSMRKQQYWVEVSLFQWDVDNRLEVAHWDWVALAKRFLEVQTNKSKDQPKREFLRTLFNLLKVDEPVRGIHVAWAPVFLDGP